MTRARKFYYPKSLIKPQKMTESVQSEQTASSQRGNWCCYIDLTHKKPAIMETHLYLTKLMTLLFSTVVEEETVEGR